MDVHELWYGLLGLLAGVIGTLVGAGGGFVIIPALMTLWPERSPQEITATSLAVVFFNGASATWIHSRAGRVDWRMGWRFALAAVPGAFFGASLLKGVSTELFTGAFGVFLLGMAGILLRKSLGGSGGKVSTTLAGSPEEPGLRSRGRSLEGLAILFSALVSFLASALGIGGGIFYVPALIYWFQYPVHRATATSQYVMTLMSAVAIAVHWSSGIYRGLPHLEVIILVVTAVLGAQIGARLGPKIKGPVLVTGLACVMGTLGIRLLLRSFGS